MSDSVTPWTVAHQAPLSMEFSRQEYWNGLPLPSTEDLLNPGTERWYSALQADSYCLNHQERENRQACKLAPESTVRSKSGAATAEKVPEARVHSRVTQHGRLPGRGGL